MTPTNKPIKSEETLAREKEQRERLEKRLAGRPRQPINFDDFAPIYWDENGCTA